ncbi:hypothetical protein M3Y97_00613100 [Aphelenchoides bicaudatus]|nr:hypothetical protein M3Y97_00613100 [Aphelenchoides bicaudatus]
MLRVGRLNKRYLEIYGLIDMSELMELLKKGLHQLENELFATENTPVRKEPKQSNKSKLSDIAVEALLTLLNLPSCTQYIVEKHMHYITGFIEQFERICSSCIANLQNEHSVNLQVFFSCWKIWTVMSIMKFNESAYKSTDDKQKKPLNIVKDSRRRSAIIKSEIEFDRVTDPMLKECCWMQHHINDCRELSANSDLVEHFYNMISLHLKSYKHFKSAIQSVIDYVKELHKMQEEFPRTRSINQPYQTVLKAGEHAMEYAESDFVIMQPVE